MTENHKITAQPRPTTESQRFRGKIDIVRIDNNGFKGNRKAIGFSVKRRSMRWRNLSRSDNDTQRN
jgi:hypothetical protein